MFSFFTKAKPHPKGKPGPDSLPPQRMELTERKTYRRELLYQAVKEAFLSLEVISSMYKFKVMNVDVRHHRFVVMIDVTKSFQTRKSSRPQSFYDIESFIKKNTFERYGIIVEGIYWRVINTETPFQPASGIPANTKARAPASQRNRDLDSVMPQQLVEEHSFMSLTESERKAFMDAIQQGARLPVIRVGDREYQSDLAPLDGGERVGGTQYGKLE